VSLLLEGYNTAESDLYLLEYLGFVEQVEGISEMSKMLREYIEFTNPNGKEQYFNDLPIKQLYDGLKTIKEEKDRLQSIVFA
jgi:hypothetical protein